MTRAIFWLAPIMLFPCEVMAAMPECVEAQVGVPTAPGVQLEDIQLASLIHDGALAGYPAPAVPLAA